MELHVYRRYLAQAGHSSGGGESFSGGGGRNDRVYSWSVSVEGAGVVFGGWPAETGAIEFE